MKPYKSWILIVAILGLIYNPVFAQKGGKYKIKGAVTNQDSGVVFLLEQNLSTGKLQPKDSVVLEDGKFELSGTIESPEIYYLGVPRLNQENKVLHIFLEPGKFTVTGDANQWDKASFKGSKNHDLYQSFVDSIRKVNSTFENLGKELQAEQKAGNTTQVVAIQSNINELKQNYFSYLAKYISDHPKTSTAQYLTLMYVVDKMPLGGVDTLAKKLDPALGGNKYGKAIEARLAVARKGAIGYPAMDFTQNDTAGNPITLSDLKGKYVLIDFWASWCRPCRMENPNLRAAYNKYKDNGFEILGVSLDRNRYSWIKAIHADRLPWVHVSDLKSWGNEVAQMYGIHSIPDNYLLDPEGNIIAKSLRGKALEAKLEELFN